MSPVVTSVCLQASQLPSLSPLGKTGTVKPNLLTPVSYYRAFCIITGPWWFRGQALESNMEMDPEESFWTVLFPSPPLLNGDISTQRWDRIRHSTWHIVGLHIRF